MPKTINLRARSRVTRFDRFQRDPNVRERTPEEASKARMWKGLGIAAGAAGMVGLHSAYMKMRHQGKPLPGGKWLDDTIFTSPERKAELAIQRAAVQASKRVNASAKVRSILFGRRTGITRLQRNVARAVIYFNPQGEDGKWLPSLDPLAAFNKGRRMMTSVNRAGSIAEDTGDIIAGRPRQPGKKRFYEKQWFKNAVLGGVGIGGYLWVKRNTNHVAGNSPDS